MLYVVNKLDNLFERMAFDLSFYPRLDYQANMTQTTSAVNETNTSMHMKALALKYLTDEQLAEVAVQRQGSASVKHLMVSNVQGTNMSFATMRYLERYQLLPGKNNVQAEGRRRSLNNCRLSYTFELMNYILCCYRYRQSTGSNTSEGRFKIHKSKK